MAVFPAYEIYALFTLKNIPLVLFVVHIYIILDGIFTGITDKFYNWIDT